MLDDIGRARDHGELEGGFRQVAESLESRLAKLGLEQFGTPGELFDPNVHEALMHTVPRRTSRRTPAWRSSSPGTASVSGSCGWPG